MKPDALGRSKRILIVDDEAVTRLILGRLLTKASYEQAAAASFEEGLTQLRGGSFGMMLTDKNLGLGPTGVDLAREARKLHPNIGVIMITGFASAESANELFKLGIDDYVTKPFELAALLERIGQVFESRLGPKPAASVRRHVLVCGVELGLRLRMGELFAEMRCEVRDIPSVLEGLRAAPSADVVVVAAQLIDTPMRRELFLWRVKQPALRVVVVGEPTTLEHTLAAIGVAAFLRISKHVDQAGLREAVVALLAGAPS